MKKCLNCECYTNNAKFCSKSCSAKYNNFRSRKVFRYCLNCSGELNNKLKQRKYCGIVCQNEHMFKTKTLPRILSGNANIETIKKYIVDTRGNVCVECGNIGVHNGKN